LEGCDEGVLGAMVRKEVNRGQCGVNQKVTRRSHFILSGDESASSSLESMKIQLFFFCFLLLLRVWLFASRYLTPPASSLMHVCGSQTFHKTSLPYKDISI
jgi:hypothetical protein